MLVEGLEPRQLMTTNLPAPSIYGAYDVVSNFSKPTESVSSSPIFDGLKSNAMSSASTVAPQSFLAGGIPEESALSRYLSETDSALAFEAGTAHGAAWRDFDTRYSEISGDNSAPELSTIRKLSLEPSSLQKMLVGNGLTKSALQDSFVGPVLPNSVYDTGNNFAAQLFPTSGSIVVSAARSSQAQVPVDSSGWYCNADGSHGNPHGVVSEQGEGEDPQAGDGDSDDGDEITIPQVDFPNLVLAEHTGTLDDYSPATTSVGKVVTTLGDFTEDTSPDSDMTLPGVHFVHIVDRIWIDAAHWSITETLVMSFNLSETSTPSESTGSDDTEGGAESDEWDLDAHSVTETSSLSVTVTRSGFVILTFHAERGMTTPAAAGVKWAIGISFRDEASISIAAGGGRTIAPRPELTSSGSSGGGGSSSSGGGTAGEDNGTGGEESDSGYSLDGDSGDSGADDLPADLNSTSSWTFNIGLRVWIAGGLSISSTPSIVSSAAADGGTAIERVIEYSNNIDAGVGLALGASWAATSSSGDINTPDPSIVLPAAPGEAIDYFDGMDVEIDGQQSSSGDAQPINVPDDGVFNFDTEAAREAWSTDPGRGWSPFPEPVGRGHQFGNSGSSATSLTNQSNGGLRFRARVRGNDQLTELSGNLRSGFSNAIGDQLQDNQMLVFRAGSGDGNSVWNGSIVAGRNISPQASLSVRSVNEFDIGLGADNKAELVTVEDSAGLDVGSSDSGLTFETLTMEMATRTPLANGGVQYSYDKLVEAHGDAGSSSGSLGVSTKVDSPVDGKLNLEWDSNGYQLLDVSNVLYFRKITPPVSADDGGSQETGTLREQTVWQFVYHSGGDTDDSLTATGDVDSTGSADSGSLESLTYSSVATNASSFSGSVSHGNSDYLRTARYYKEFTTDEGYDAASTPASTSSDDTSGDERVIVTGHLNKDSWGHMMPWHAWLRQDIGAGTSIYHGEGGRTTIVPVQVNYDPRNDYERALSGSTVPPSEPPVEEPDSYPSNINANDTLNGILTILAVSYWNFDRGVLQGKLNIANGLTDTVVDSSPLLWLTPLSGWDWSRDMIVHEDEASHDFSKWAGAAGVVTLLTLGAGAMVRIASVNGGRTVLGHYPAYTELAEQIAARRFNIPASVWLKMTEAERWAANTKFLDRMIARGDDVILATRADLAKPGSYFARELEYLLSKGFKISADGLSLIAPGRP